MSGNDKEKPLQRVSPEAKVPATDELNQRFRKETEGAIAEWDETSQDANTYFMDWVHKLLQSDRYSKKDCEQFLGSFFSKNPKLDINSLYWFKYLCSMKDISKWSYFENHIDVFSDIPLEDLLMSNQVDEVILDKLNFSYDSEGFNLLQKTGKIEKFYKCEKWHNLTKGQVMRLAQREANHEAKKHYTDRKTPTQYLSLLKEGEIDEEIIYYFTRNLSSHLFYIFPHYHEDDSERCKNELDKYILKIKELLDKYNIDYIKFCKLLFIGDIDEWKKIEYLYGVDQKKLLDNIQKYLNETEVDGFIPKNIAEILDNDKDIQLLIKNNAVDIMDYCDKVECDIQFSGIGREQPFVIGVNPTEKKIKIFSSNELLTSGPKNEGHYLFHNLPEGVGFSIVGGGLIKKGGIDGFPTRRGTIHEDEIDVYGSSKDFGGFQEYGGLIYRILEKNFPGKTIHLSPQKKSNSIWIDGFYIQGIE